METPTTKKKRGGPQPGAGRPKKEPTKLMRIPLSLVDIVTQLINKKANPPG
ncbi:MAG: hypothetical protein ACK5OS_01880 [Chryseotalea sp.]